jgi:hypothetical protein
VAWTIRVMNTEMTNKASQDLATRYCAGLRSPLGGNHCLRDSVAQSPGTETATAAGGSIAMARIPGSAMVWGEQYFDAVRAAEPPNARTFR